MDLKEMTVEQLEERKSAIVGELDNEGADLDALEEEVRAIKAELEAREAEERLKAIEQKELKRWHNIDMGLRIAAVVATVLTTVAFTGVTLVQTRMNYVDNVYDAAPASRMILNAIGKLVKPPQL